MEQSVEPFSCCGEGHTGRLDYTACVWHFCCAADAVVPLLRTHMPVAKLHRDRAQASEGWLGEGALGAPATAVQCIEPTSIILIVFIFFFFFHPPADEEK